MRGEVCEGRGVWGGGGEEVCMRACAWCVARVQEGTGKGGEGGRGGSAHGHMIGRGEGREVREGRDVQVTLQYDMSVSCR